MDKYIFSLEDAYRFADFMKIEVKVQSGNLVFKNCPYCKNISNDKNSFSISLQTGQFHCFRASCMARGNMYTLARDFSFPLEYIHTKNIQNFRKLPPKGKPDSKQPAVQYMLKRGISETITKRYNITTQTGKDNILVFPFYDENEVMCFVKYRKTDYNKEKDSSKEWCERNCKPILFGMNHCNFENKTLVITEGQIDSLSLAEAGIENAVSVPNGAKGFTWLNYCWDFLAKFDTLIVFGDYEKNKITLLDELTERFNGIVKHIREQDYLDCKDANEILLKHGRDALIKAVNQAIPVEHPQIVSLADVKSFDLGNMENYSSGLPSLDKTLGGFFFGQLIILTGERGEGKSTLVSQFGIYALKAGYNVLFYSGELVDGNFKAWFDVQIAGENYINRKTESNGANNYSVDANALDYIKEWYKDKIYLLNYDLTSNTGDTLTKLLEIAIKQYGCRVLVVDNLMMAMVDNLAYDQYRQQTIFVSELARIAKRHNVIIFLIAHPRKKQGYDFENDDVAGSSNITNLADVVLCYSRPRDKNTPPDTSMRILTVTKNRLTGQTNRQGIPLYFQPSSKRISENATDFNWEIGWEKHYKQLSFYDVTDDMDLPFN